ncbi:hypothetical protein Tsubulata_028699, partial [Turnera subulata]
MGQNNANCLHLILTLRMENLLLHSLVFIFIITLTIKFLLERRKQERKLPPSPPAIPIIGHLHLLKQPLHRTFHSLSQKYGPIVSVKLGSRLAIVVSSPSLVEECFTKNDIVFANRPFFSNSRYLTYNHSTMGRRVQTLFPKRFHFNSGYKYLNSKLIIMRMVAGKRYYGEGLEQVEEGRRFREIMTEFVQCTEVSDPADIFPILKVFGFKGAEEKCMRVGKRLDEFLQGLIDRHRSKKDGNTMINRMLDLQQSQPEYYTDEIIKGLIQ